MESAFSSVIRWQMQIEFNVVIIAIAFNLWTELSVEYKTVSLLLIIFSYGNQRSLRTTDTSIVIAGIDYLGPN